jgi:prolyl oligopeptidase
LLRLGKVDDLIDTAMAMAERGRKAGYMPPRILMQRVPDQLALQVVEFANESPFFKAFENMPDSIPASERERLRSTASETIENDVLPAYRKLDKYFNTRYLPATRDSVGLSALPNGSTWYEYLTRSFTTTRMTPDDIHRLGLEEVLRIREEMQEIIEQVEFEGSFQDFLVFLRTDPQFYYDNPEDLHEAYLATCKRIDPELVNLFGILPRMPYGVKPIPDSIAPDTTTAYYSRPAADGSRAGTYWVNLYRPEVRPKYEIEVLSVHEAMPGHHLQIALQQELSNMPNFRRFLGFTAFVEGWGLYSERLGYDLGLYKDPYSRFGQLTYDMWRAVRLVVDTGMHYKGWTRQQAIDFFTDNAAKAEHDIVNEIDRYIGNPGQALAYKIGQLKILTLRARAERQLGENFDIRDFHDELLGAGALPLDLLELRMDAWLATAVARPTGDPTASN